MGATELAPSPPPSSMCWHGEGKDVLPLCPLLPMAGERAGPGNARVRKLALPYTRNSTQGSGTYTPLGQHTRDDHVIEVTGDPVLSA